MMKLYAHHDENATYCSSKNNSMQVEFEFHARGIAVPSAWNCFGTMAYFEKVRSYWQLFLLSLKELPVSRAKTGT